MKNITNQNFTFAEIFSLSKAAVSTKLVFMSEISYKRPSVIHHSYMKQLHKCLSVPLCCHDI